MKRRNAPSASDADIAAGLSHASELLELAAVAGVPLDDVAKLARLSVATVERLHVAEMRLAASPAHARFASAVDGAFAELLAHARRTSGTAR